MTSFAGHLRSVPESSSSALLLSIQVPRRPLRLKMVDTNVYEHYARARLELVGGSRKVDVRLPEKGNSISYDARPVHLIITMMKWIRTSRLSIEKSLSGGAGSFRRVQELRRGEMPTVGNLIGKEFKFKNNLSRRFWPL